MVATDNGECAMCNGLDTDSVEFWLDDVCVIFRAVAAINRGPMHGKRSVEYQSKRARTLLADAGDSTRLAFEAIGYGESKEQCAARKRAVMVLNQLLAAHKSIPDLWLASFHAAMGWANQQLLIQETDS